MQQAKSRLVLLNRSFGAILRPRELLPVDKSIGVVVEQLVQLAAVEVDLAGQPLYLAGVVLVCQSRYDLGRVKDL